MGEVTVRRGVWGRGCPDGEMVGGALPGLQVIHKEWPPPGWAILE